MKTFIFVVLLEVISVAGVKHSLHYFYTASSGIPGFPEFLTAGEVNGQPISYYDSVIKREVPKQEWMAETEGAEYWDRETQISIYAEKLYKASIDNVRQRLNQTKGVHIVQRMYGCEWDDETDEVDGFNQFGYDGEDFISFDLKTDTWIAPKRQAFITKMKWDHERSLYQKDKDYITQECREWLKKYVNYGRSSLMRKELPSVSLLQKTASSPVTCHATGFYPDRADLFWTKDGEELHEDVDKGEILPNHDGSFQMSVDLKVSSIAPEDWKRHHCVFQLSGVNDIRTKLDKAVIRTNEGSSEFPVGAVALGVVVGPLVLKACIAGVLIWRRNNNGFRRTNTSDTSSSSAEDPDLKKISDEQKIMIK